jgi:hypothetical protein
MDLNENSTNQFQHPFTMCVSGCTGSGKSEWVLRLLRHADAMISPPPRCVLYCYGEMNVNIFRLQQQEAKQKFENKNAYDGGGGGGKEWKLQVHYGIPDETHVQRMASECGGRLLLVLDDLIVGLKSTFLDILFTRGSHNWGCSVVLVTQHLFASPHLRVARNNSHYLVLMRNPVGALQIRNLATQLFPGRQAHQFFVEAYADATVDQFGYLLVDMHPKTAIQFRLRTYIYPGEQCIVYIANNSISESSSSGNKGA